MNLLGSEPAEGRRGSGSESAEGVPSNGLCGGGGLGSESAEGIRSNDLGGGGKLNASAAAGTTGMEGSTGGLYDIKWLTVDIGRFWAKVSKKSSSPSDASQFDSLSPERMLSELEGRDAGEGNMAADPGPFDKGRNSDTSGSCDKEAKSDKSGDPNMFVNDVSCLDNSSIISDARYDGRFSLCKLSPHDELELLAPPIF